MNVKDCMSFEEWSKALAKENEEREKENAKSWASVAADMAADARKKAEKEAAEKVRKAYRANGVMFDPALYPAFKYLTDSFAIY